MLIDDQPLTKGYVRFVPDDARPSSGEIRPDGTFTLQCFEGAERADGAVLGQHRVAVIANEAIGETEMRWFAPQKYADYTTSGIVVEITGPTDDVEIKIASDVNGR